VEERNLISQTDRLHGFLITRRCLRTYEGRKGIKKGANPRAVITCARTPITEKIASEKKLGHGKKLRAYRRRRVILKSRPHGDAKRRLDGQKHRL